MCVVCVCVCVLDYTWVPHIIHEMAAQCQLLQFNSFISGAPLNITQDLWTTHDLFHEYKITSKWHI